MKRSDCPIEKEELSRLYSDLKMTDQEIADHLGSTVKRVRSWRKRLGVSTLARYERNEIVPIVGPLRSLLVGSMLGDGRLDRLPNSTRYTENHCNAQREYAEWKVAQWGIWVSNGLKPVSWKLKGTVFHGWRFETHAHDTLNEWHALFYDPQGPKLLRPGVIDLVDTRALAIWYMDDGTSGWWPSITFGMPPESRDVAFRILAKFSLHPRWVPRKNNTGDLIFEGEDQAHLFISLVAPHIPECMQYKLDFGFQGPHYQVRKLLPESLLRDLSSKGVPIKRMAKELGASHTTIDRHLKKHGISHLRTVGRPPE
jgi:hypothetical protein